MNDVQEILPDIPRIYTALAEWLACMAIILYAKKRIEGWKFAGLCAVMLLVQSIFLVITGGLEGIPWLLCMNTAIGIMVIFFYMACDINWMGAAYYTALAFVTAETVASLEWQISLYGKNVHGEMTRFGECMVFVLVYSVFYAVIWRMNRRLLEKGERLEVDPRQFLETSIIAGSVFFISNLGFLTVDTPFSGRYGREIFNIRTFADVAGLAVMYAYHLQWCDQKVRRELESIQIILHNQYAQYQQSQKTLDIINYKYHDLKHHIIALRSEEDMDKRNDYLDKMEEEIQNYEAQNKTGNKVLDTLLTSKSMVCQQHDISMTCVVDGMVFEFMDVMDICSIFGNALDNAIECEKKIKEKDKRMIHVNAYTKKEFLIIKIENYYEGSIEFKKDLPVTTKKSREYHGYGLKSLKYTVHKYKGEVDISVENSWFSLKILIPL